MSLFSTLSLSDVLINYFSYLPLLVTPISIHVKREKVYVDDILILLVHFLLIFFYKSGSELRLINFKWQAVFLLIRSSCKFEAQFIYTWIANIQYWKNNEPFKCVRTLAFYILYFILYHCPKLVEFFFKI